MLNFLGLTIGICILCISGLTLASAYSIIVHTKIDKENSVRR